MTPQELKNSILQLAIQGKLVEQCPEEGTAEELYKQIQAEKQALIKAGKLKKEKPLPEITEDEKPFEIPESWMWCHPQELASVVVGATPSTSNPAYWQNGIIPWLPSGCCQDCDVLPSDSSIKLISCAAYDSCSTKLMPPNTIMIALTGATAGKVGLLRFEACGNQSIVGISPVKPILPEFIFYQLMARRREILSDCVGSAQPHISKDYIVKMCFALPPLAEQKRIVSKIEELLPLIDRYEQAWTRLEDFNKRFPGDLQKSILQIAIQGKLVEQRPEEGTGKDLYWQIQAEKQALIKAGKIKKEKPLPEISEDEIPFEIPETWKWVRLGWLTELITSGSRDWAKYYANSGDIFLRMGNLSRDSFNLRLEKIQHVCVPENAEGQRTSLLAGDLLFSITGEVGTLGLIPENFGKAYINQHTAMLRFLQLVRNKYIPYLLLSDYAHEYYNGNQHGIKNSFRLDSISFMPVPLPPLAEQKRIVARLEELLPLCERLK